MRGPDIQRSEETFMASPASLVPEEHPLRAIKAMVNEVLAEMDPLFEAIYSFAGRPSIPPERLLRAQLIRVWPLCVRGKEGFTAQASLAA